VDQVIPLSCNGNQSFPVTLSVDGANLTLNLALRYSEVAGYWVLTISDADGNLLVDSVPMICGAWPAGNLLCQQAYLKIGSAYIINANNSPMDHPDDTNLGTDFLLLWGDSPAF